MSSVMPRVALVLSRQTGLTAVEALGGALDTVEMYELEPHASVARRRGTQAVLRIAQ